MENFEKIEAIEGLSESVVEIPQNHLEGMEHGDTIEMDQLAENVFSREVKDFKGIYQEWLELSGNDSEGNIFKHVYCDYLFKPEALSSTASEIYQFMKEKVFFGKEYTGGETQEVGTGVNKLNDSNGKSVSFLGYNTTEGTTKSSDCDLWASDGGYITCWNS